MTIAKTKIALKREMPCNHLLALNVLDDFFAMMNFDYLIRAGSAYSEMAGNLGRVKMEIWPYDLRWEGNTLIITEVGIAERKQVS